MLKMDEFMIQFAILFPSFFAFFLIKKLFLPTNAKKNLPPSPPKLPIIGNLHQLGPLPHRYLQLLAQKHGPLMLLHFGSTPALIVSSADAARECKTNDLHLANRPKLKIVEQNFYNMKSLLSSPYGEFWRQTRSIFVHQLLSNKKVQLFNVIMKEEIALLVKRIKDSSVFLQPVDLSTMFTSLTNDLISRSAFGRKYSDTEDGKKYLRVMNQTQELLTNFGICEFVPWLSWVNRLNGYNHKAEMVLKEGDKFLDEVIQKRLGDPRHESKEDMLDILLNIYNGNTSEASIDMDVVRGLIKDVFGAGTESTSALLEWAVTELLRHPEVMKKLQNEVSEILRGRVDITSNDLQRMHYLKAVIKETFRCHPPVPLIPREAGRDVKVMGYDIAAGTMVLVNAFAIGKNPALWEEREKFEPERFLNSTLDFNGLHSQFLPFGSGRRICPGMNFAIASLELVLASLMHKFDWELPLGVKGENLDTAEHRGLVVELHLCFFSL